MKLGSYFETGKRENGESFITLKDGAPEWLRDAIQEAHCSDLPDDWTYAECKAACEAIDEGDGMFDSDSMHEHADGRVDIYTKDRFQWAADHCLGDVFARAEDDAKDMGLPEDTNDRLGAIQYHAIYLIAATILQAYENQKGDDEEASA